MSTFSTATGNYFSQPFQPDKRLLILSPDAPAPRTEVIEYLHELAISAENAATSISCSSILAGHTSESDEYGDVAFFIGRGGDSVAPGDVVAALGLTGTGREMPISRLTGTTTQELESFTQKLSTLKQQSFFCVESDSVSAFVLLGKLESGWGGLVGLGGTYN